MKFKLTRLTIRKSKLMSSRKGVIFILLTTIALVHQAGIFKLYYLTAIFTSVIMFGWSLLIFIRQEETGNRKFKAQLKEVAKLLLIPWIVFVLYNFLIHMFGIADTQFMKSSFIQIMFTPCIILGALGGYYLFRSNTLRYFLYAVFLHYVIVLIYQLFNLGVIDFFRGAISVFTGEIILNPFETNSDLVLALGLILIYYCDSFIRRKTSENTHAILLLVLIILGGKRIELLALVAICLASIMVKMWNERRRHIMEFVISVILVLLLFVFVFLEISGILSAFIYSHGINAMGRMQMWDYVAQFTEFTPQYLGKGYAFSNLLLEKDRVWVYGGHTYVLHSDVLKIYFDLGFAMFTFWILYNLFYFPHKVRIKYGFRIENLTWFLVIYLFILYLTDNCINYYAVQSLFVYVLLKSIEYNTYYENTKCKYGSTDLKAQNI